MTSRRANAALALLALTQLVLVLDASIVNVALPSIGRDLDVPAADLSWVVNAYVLMFGGFLLLGGRVADHAGRRAVFMAGLALFSAASLAGGTAQSALWLALARGAQGLGAALVSSSAMALLMTLFAEGPERTRALGAWAAAGACGGALGAIVGGLLTDGLGWQAVLFVNVPVGIVAVLLAPRLLPEARADGPRRRFDVAGAVTVTAGLTLLVYAVVDADDAGWGSTQTVSLAALALILLAVFVAIESIAERPLVPLDVFRNRPLRGANLVTVLNTGALFPMFFFVTLYTQQVLGYDPVESGLAQLPLAAALAASATLAPRVVARTGYKAALVAGLVVAAAGLLWLSAIPTDGSFLGSLLGPSLVVGLGQGIVWVSSMVGATSGVETSQTGLASGLVNTAQQLGGALGVAALVAVATARTGDVLAAAEPDRLAALTEGFQAGLTGSASVVAVGAVVALMLLPSAAAGHAPPASDAQPAPSGAIGGGAR